MARWIEQTLHINKDAEILLGEKSVIIQCGDNQGWDGCGIFRPSTREEANSMSVALRLAAKRLEDIGKAI